MPSRCLRSAIRLPGRSPPDGDCAVQIPPNKRFKPMRYSEGKHDTKQNGKTLFASSGGYCHAVYYARCGVSRHSFDNSDLPSAVVQARGNIWTRCRFVERTVGEIVNPETNQASSLSDPCFSRGPTVGYLQSAHADSLQAVKILLTTTFKLRR